MNSGGASECLRCMVELPDRGRRSCLRLFHAPGRGLCQPVAVCGMAHGKWPESPNDASGFLRIVFYKKGVTSPFPARKTSGESSSRLMIEDG